MKRKEARKLAESFRDAAPEARQQLLASYADWIKQGARAQGAAGQWGIVFLGVCIFTAFLMVVQGIGTPLLYAGCSVGAVVGVLLAWRGAARERNWRKANPFQQE